MKQSDNACEAKVYSIELLLKKDYLKVNIVKAKLDREAIAKTLKPIFTKMIYFNL